MLKIGDNLIWYGTLCRYTPKYKHSAINKNPQINKPMRFSHSRQNIKIWRKQISWHKCHIWTVLFYQCAPPPPTTQPVPSDPPPPPIPRLMGGNYSVSDCIHIYTYMSENVFLGKYKCFFIYKPTIYIYWSCL